MIKISIDDTFADIDKINNKDINTLTFEDTIILAFYFSKEMSDTYYTEFKNELNKQNDDGWPKLLFTRNDKKQRLDILFTASFIPTDNLLLLLLQLLYIEKSKRFNDINKIYVSFTRYEILDHCFDSSSEDDYNQLSLDNLLEMLESYIVFYMEMYNDSMLYEHKLAERILHNL